MLRPMDAWVRVGLVGFVARRIVGLVGIASDCYLGWDLAMIRTVVRSRNGMVGIVTVMSQMLIWSHLQIPVKD